VTPPAGPKQSGQIVFECILAKQTQFFVGKLNHSLTRTSTSTSFPLSLSVDYLLKARQQSDRDRPSLGPANVETRAPTTLAAELASLIAL
jgi:hypothetical protein